MSITILPATISDLSSIVSLRDEAFKNDALGQAFTPADLTPDQHEELKEWWTGNRRQHLLAPNNHYFKAVDSSSEKLVGYVGVHGPKPEGYVANPKHASAPSFLVREILVGIREKCAAAKKDVFGDREDLWYIQSLAVDPAYQGRGIAGMLLGHALQTLVDRDGGECFTEATPAGRRAYEKAGFVKVRDIVMLEGYVVAFMVRPAQAKVKH